MHIQNPYATRPMDAVVLTIEMVAKMRVDVTLDYKITGKVTDITSTIKDFQTYFYSLTTVEGLAA